MSFAKKLVPVLLPAFLLIIGCSAPGASDSAPIAGAEGHKLNLPETNWTEGETSTDNAPTSGEFTVKFETTAGDFVMLVHRNWSPRGAERFYQLIKNKYYDGAPFYRVVPGFMVQFGMNGDPAGTDYWSKPIPDEPSAQSNTIGMVTYAKSGPNTRSVQLFINYANNGPSLDPQGFPPFAEIIEGMNKVNAINAQYRERPNQGAMRQQGNEYVFTEFPRIDYIKTVTFVGGDVESAGDGSSTKSIEGQ